MITTNYSGSGFIKDKGITESTASQIGNKIANFKIAHDGKLNEKDVHDLIRTAASDDGVVSQQEMDWINDGLSSQGELISKLSVNKGEFGEAVQFNFTMSKKDGSSATEYKSEDMQGKAGKTIGSKHKVLADKSYDGNVNSIEEKKLNALSKITQKMSKGVVSENKCGASCIVSAVIYSKGREGIAKLAEIAKSQVKAPFALPSEYDSLVDKLKDTKQPLTKEDVSKLQDMVYLVLHNKQDVKWKEKYGTESSPGGLHTTIVKDFMSSPEMKSLIGKDLNIRNIDFNGDGKSDHFVLFIGEKTSKPAVYDPWPRKDGNQVVTNPKEVETYRDAVSDS